MYKIYLSIGISLMLFNMASLSAESISRFQAAELMEQCQVFREQKIMPLKTKEVNQCVEKGKSMQRCQRFYKDFGETYLAANGYQQIGMFWDAPICVQALKLEKYFRVYPGKNSFN